jgi:hypothetical protein
VNFENPEATVTDFINLKIIVLMYINIEASFMVSNFCGFSGDFNSYYKHVNLHAKSKIMAC